jgi:hypothetical protein
MLGIGTKKNELSKILEEGLYYISENQEEKHKYTHDDFISVLFKELKYLIHKT